MCGIAGHIVLAPSDRQPVTRQSRIRALTVEKMCEAILHRGPNQQGIRLWSRAALGFRRLSIIDLSANADQPMANEDESLWLVFNGEIYNFHGLRDELQRLGHRFRSQSDGEVILHGFEAWGEAILDKLDGMFAFALYRPADNYLFAARDPFGIKPFYYYHRNDELLFASEIKALLTYEPIKPLLNHEAMRAYLTLGYVPGPETMFATVRKLPPGHMLEAVNGEVKVKRYWHMVERESDLSDAALETELRRNVQDSMVSDVPLGVFLSGGLDSTLLTMYAQRDGEKIKSFSVGFSDYPLFDESAKSERVATELGTDHHSLQIEAAAATVLPKVVRALEEPLADPSIIPTYHLAALTHGFVTVALSGEGGDELLGGYNRYVWEPAAGRFGKLATLAAPLLPILERIPTPGRAALPNLIRRIRKFLRTAAMPREERYLSWFALMLPDQIDALLGATGKGGVGALPRFRQLFADTSFKSSLRQLQYVDIQTMLVDNLLLKADKIGMSQSLEMRVPFLNRRCAELLFNLPDRQKIEEGATKKVERRLIAKRLGEEFAAQRKQGFEVPIGDWIRGPGREFITAELSEAAMPHRLFDTTVLGNLLAEHLDKRRDWGLALFAVVVFNIWYREFKVQLS